uniref:Mannose receptor, C type 1b n=1 Tax=Astatotilapia calliptera TaxID=8154 RepID=A0AAX7VPN3_ASTCA
MMLPRISLAVFGLFITTCQCSTTNDSPFSLMNKATGFCLLKRVSRCLDLRWTTDDRLYVTTTKKCLGAQGKSIGSEVSLYDCDDKSDLQKWECRNGTLLALKNNNLFIEMKADETIALSKTTGPNNQFTITGTSSGACTRTYRELFTIEGNALGKICMFPFLYKDRWYGDCTTFDSSTKRPWCAVETKFEREQWGYCPTTSTDHWRKNLITGAYYQLNIQSSLTWGQADTSCKQQAASLVSIVEPSEQALISALLGAGRKKLWIGLVLDPEHGWQWTDGKPFRYLRWDSGKSSLQGRILIYLFFSSSVEQGFCSAPWIPYNGHCFHLQRNAQTWSGAQKACRAEGGDLATVRNVEDQSFVISQLGYASTDELWIGLNDIRTEGLFDWSDQSHVSFTSWEYGKPGLSTDGDDCVLIRGENGNWADRSCDEQHGFICMKQSSTESTGNEPDIDIGCKGWKKHGSYCYFVGTETKTFSQASEDCKSSNSYLADVSNGVDNAFLVSLVGLRPEKHFWIGLSNQKNIDVFEWTNSPTVRFTHWNSQMPGYQQGCVAMTTGVLAGLWDLLPCTNKEKYICKYMAEGMVPTAPPPTVAPPKCPEGWTRVGTKAMCAKFFTGPRSEEKTWFEARDYCRAIGGDLLSIHSSAELRLFRYSGKAWIGLHIPETTTGYAWTDGSPVNFQHWQEGEPNNFNNAESCAEFVIHNWDEEGSWNDLNCDSYNDWLCQIRAGVTPKLPSNNTVVEFNTTSDGWLERRGNQYYINRMSMPMEDARHFCQQRHSDLVSITSKEENVFLWKQVNIYVFNLSYGRYYIGLSVDLDGSAWWMDGTPVSFRRWDEDQPSTSGFDQNCVFMSYHMGFWRTSNCGRELSFICKRGRMLPTNTTAAPTVAPTGGCPKRWMKFGTKVRLLNLYFREVFKMTTLQQRPTIKFYIEPLFGFKSSTDLWIGLNAISQEGFFWTDGKKRQYTNWGYSVTNPLYNYHIKINTQNLTWDDAQKRCNAEKANLASLRNDWTQAYVELLAIKLNSPLWIGLNKQQTGGYFKYIDGWHLNNAGWAEFEPSRDKPCVYVDVDGKWRTAFCNVTIKSACMQSTEVAPTESTIFPGNCPEDTDLEYQQSYTWLPYRGYCYLFIQDEIEWADAASSCVRHGGVLASIEDPSEQEFIKGFVTNFKDRHNSFWIGLFKTHKGMATISVIF